MPNTPSAANSPAADAPRGRRTQGERSRAMRKRLLAATLESLAEVGYAGSNLSSIVRRAGVSRGAQVHHYPSKQALMVDAAEELVRGSYRALGEVMLAIVDEDDRLQALVDSTWAQIFATPMFRAYAELLAESQRDPPLAEALRQTLGRASGVFDTAIDHYFEGTPGSHADIKPIFLQLMCLLCGLASQAHLLHDPAPLKRQLSAWVQQVSPLMRARKGVRTPPPRPPTWDRRGA